MARLVVTGANRGIGLELCRQLRARGDEVVALCRRSSPELDATGARVEAGIDVATDRIVEELRGRLRGVRVDGLLLNAGVLHGDGLEPLDFGSIREQFETNALGPLRVVSALLSNLGRGAKVVVLTSRMGSITDNASGGYYGYRMSKAAVNIASVSMARDLRERGIAVAVVHPGFVRTAMTHGAGNIGPDEAARGVLARMDELTLARSGGFWHANGERLPW